MIGVWGLITGCNVGSIFCRVAWKLPSPTSQPAIGFQKPIIRCSRFLEPCWLPWQPVQKVTYNMWIHMSNIPYPVGPLGSQHGNKKVPRTDYANVRIVNNSLLLKKKGLWKFWIFLPGQHLLQWPQHRCHSSSTAAPYTLRPPTVPPERMEPACCDSTTILRTLKKIKAFFWQYCTSTTWNF